MRICNIVSHTLLWKVRLLMVSVENFRTELAENLFILSLATFQTLDRTWVWPLFLRNKPFGTYVVEGLNSPKI